MTHLCILYMLKHFRMANTKKKKTQAGYINCFSELRTQLYMFTTLHNQYKLKSIDKMALKVKKCQCWVT